MCKPFAWKVLGILPVLKASAVTNQDDEWQKQRRLRLYHRCMDYVIADENEGRRTFFSEILGILQIIPNIIPNLGILGRVPSEPSMLGGVPNADRNIPFRAFIQCSVGARTDTIIK